MTLEIQTFEVLTLEAPTLEAFWRHWRLYQKKTLEARRHLRPILQEGLGKHSQGWNIRLCEAFVKPVVREIQVERLNRLRP